MKKSLLTLSFVSFFAAHSQNFTGFDQSNYAGVTGIYMQPASIVDSRMKFDMTLVGLDVMAYNNYVGLQRSALKRDGWNFPAFSDPNFQNKYLVENASSRDKSLFVNNRIAGPSFMVNINGKNAFAISSSVRTYANIDGVSPPLAKLAYQEFNYPTYWVTNLENKNLSIQEMSWAEYGLTYAHVFKDDNEHFFKGGATVKLLQGIQSGYMFVSDLKYNFKTDTTLSIFQSNVQYGHSDNLNLKQISFGGNNNGTKIFDYSQSYPGVAFDFGAVYEWRPDYEKHKYDMDGEKGLWRKDENKYKLKVGISVTDLGSIKFKKGQTSNDFYANVGYWNLKPIAPKTIGELDDTIKKRFPQTSSASTYRMNLPTALSVQVDYNIWKTFYVNFTPFIAFQFKNHATKVHDFSSLTLTPRWDHKWFGVFVPVQYNFLDGMRAGLALRLGPIVIGTRNVAPVFGQKTIYGADVYALVKIPIPYGRPRDRDKDGISDRKDKCVNVPGVWEFMGCPDKDGDHIQDSEDKCPDVPGIKELQGCPDRDGDGITDAEDKCPDEKGPKEFNGCPDRDGDKIIDKDDECPDDPGTAEFFGCPDRDGDKTPDKYDACPDVPGPKEFKGCPDRDGDTVLDKDDDCPDVPGAVENKGCPWPDTDKDGVIDREDNCPTTPGLKELKGCPPAPVLKAEEQKILEKAFASLEFATGKDIIKKVSFPSLNELAGLMKQHAADWTLKLSGHTDNQGAPEKNMLLSEKRAKAVKKYLSTKGVKADHILTEWFGQTKPVDTNDTEAGRQHNRRVEMKVIFSK